MDTILPLDKIQACD